ncbi:phosphomethylpyrimidine synthase, partial [Candidatus Hakubella thermalkaliphila]|jgi:hypothetical protein
VP